MKRKEIQGIVLKTIGIAGFIAIAVLAPNALQAFEKLAGGRKRHYSNFYVQSVLGRLYKQGLIVFEERNGKKFARITSAGRRELSRYRLREQTAEQPRWDGKWRMIIFDIREYKRDTRDKIRRELMLFGFRRLQQSVWVYPYECEEIISLLKADHQIGKEVLYVTAEHVENDRWLRDEFRLNLSRG